MEKFALVPFAQWEEFNELSKQQPVERSTIPKSKNVPYKPMLIEPDKTQKREQILREITIRPELAQEIVEQLIDSKRIRFSENNSIILDNVDTLLDITKFVEKLVTKYGLVNSLELSILDAAGISRDFVVNRNARKREAGKWSTFSF